MGSLLSHDLVMVEDGHAPTALGKSKCGRASDAAATSRDEGDTVGKVNNLQFLSPDPLSF